MENRFEIDIKRLILELLYKSWIMILTAIVFGVAAFVYAKTQLTPMYTAAASLYVNNYNSQTQSELYKVSSTDLYTSQSLVQTYITFLSTDRVMDDVAAHFDNKYTAGQLKSMLGSSVLNETEVFQITITSPDSQAAADIVNYIAEIAPDIITNYIKGSSVEVVDYAKVPTVRSFPVYRKYIMLGFIAGGGLSAVILIIMFLFNSKISDEEDIKRLFTAPVIGKIPNFEQRSNSGYSGNYDYGYGYGSNEGKDV